LPTGSVLAQAGASPMNVAATSTRLAEPWGRSGALRSNRIEISIYSVAFLLLAALMALSPVLEKYVDPRSFPRYIDILSAVILLTRLLESRSRPLSGRDGLLVFATALFFAVSGIFQYASSDLFNYKIYLIDGKILLFLALIWVFENRPLASPRTARRLSSVLWWAGIIGTVLFIVLPGQFGRLQLLDESNYMMLIFVITGTAYLDAHGAKAGSTRWFFVYGFLVLACLAAESRTGFAMVALLVLATLFAHRRYVYLAAIGVFVLLAMAAAGPVIVETLTRGETSFARLDRFIFLQEYMLWASSQDPVTVLFGNNIGKFLLEVPQLMTYWSARQSEAQDIPFGLAAFNFHAVYLRMFADMGIVPALAFIAIIFRILRRSVSPYVLMALLIAGVSMSVFYLSAIMPFLVFAQLVRPATLRHENASDGSAPSFPTRI
jgi:hypothetical protein